MFQEMLVGQEENSRMDNMVFIDVACESNCERECG